MELFGICIIIALLFVVPDLFLLVITVLVVAGIIYLGIVTLPFALAIGALMFVVFLIKALFRSIKNKLQNSSASNDGVVLDEETQQKFFADIDTMQNNHMKKFYIYTALSPFVICLFFFVFNEISINISKECLAKDIVARADAYNYKWDDEREYNRSLHEAANIYKDITGYGLSVTRSGEVYYFEDNDWHSIKDFSYQLSHTKYTIYDKIKNYKRDFD